MIPSISNSAVLAYTRNVEILKDLLTFLAIISILIWGLVIISTIIRLVAGVWYKQYGRRA